MTRGGFLCRRSSARSCLQKPTTRFVVLRGFDNCLVAYSRPEWEAKAEQLLRLPDDQTRGAGLHPPPWFSHAAEVKLDRQGRTGIPRKLLAKAGITNQMVIIGALDKLEFLEPQKTAMIFRRWKILPITWKTLQ